MAFIRQATLAAVRVRPADRTALEPGFVAIRQTLDRWPLSGGGPRAAEGDGRHVMPHAPRVPDVTVGQLANHQMGRKANEFGAQASQAIYLVSKETRRA